MSPHNDQTLWWKILEKFGLPTLFALLLMSFIVWKETNDRDDRKTEHAAYVTAIQNNTKVLEALSSKIDVLVVQVVNMPRSQESSHDSATR